MNLKFDIIKGHVLDVLKDIPDNTVHCIVTSPPYWPSKRDYDVEPVQWGNGWFGNLSEEDTSNQYVTHLIEVCKELLRVLRPDGLFWLNIDDSRAKNNKLKDSYGIKKGDLLGIPWMTALTLRYYGWYLCSDNIWRKNTIPSGSNKQCIKNHEYIFQFAKTENYFFDQIAIREAASDKSSIGGRHKRTVWDIAVGRLRYQHLAAFPHKLVETCLACSTSEGGVCPTCGAPMKRIVSKKRIPTRPGYTPKTDRHKKANRDPYRHITVYTTEGFESGCQHTFAAPNRPTVMDPFAGSATAGEVALTMNMNFIGVELNGDYADEGIRRLKDVDPMTVEQKPQFWLP